MFSTLSNTPVERFYTQEDISDLDYDRDLGIPGEFPFTRGVYPEMYRERLWTQRQVAGFGTAEETNKRLLFLNQSGQTGLNIVPDTPTIYGYDSDHPLSDGEVGKEGVAIDTYQDMADLFKGIDLEQVSCSIIYNYPILFTMYLALARERGIPFENLAGTLQNDVFTVIAGAKAWIAPPQGTLKLATDVLEYTTHYMPRWNPVSLVGYHYREAGCTAVEEMAFTIAAGIGYIESALQRGLNVDQFGPRLSFFFDAHNDFFEEISKFRAARRLWARILRERYKAKDPRSMMLRFHVQTAGCSLTAQQPLVNIIRTTIQALAAVLGGTQSLHTNSYDEAMALPSEEAVVLALRTQQVISNESGITNTIDPLGGSYFVEALTNRLEKDGSELIEKIDKLGGMLKAVETGWVQRRIADSSLDYQRKVERGERKIVGVNCYVLDEKVKIELLKVEKELEEKQKERLFHFKAKRNEKETKKSLMILEEVLRKDKNSIESTIDAVLVGATTGEIADLYRKVFGHYVQPSL